MRQPDYPTVLAAVVLVVLVALPHLTFAHVLGLVALLVHSRVDLTPQAPAEAPDAARIEALEKQVRALTVAKTVRR